MGRYALKRLLQGAITVWFIATATFFAMHMVSGDDVDKLTVIDGFDRHK